MLSRTLPSTAISRAGVATSRTPRTRSSWANRLTSPAGSAADPLRDDATACISPTWWLLQRDHRHRRLDDVLRALRPLERHDRRPDREELDHVRAPAV